MYSNMEKKNYQKPEMKVYPMTQVCNLLTQSGDSTRYIPSLNTEDVYKA
jgi:hypothetical protein